jgi:hypothetical protein
MPTTLSIFALVVPVFPDAGIVNIYGEGLRDETTVPLLVFLLIQAY